VRKINKILITRTKEQSEEFAGLLKKCELEPVFFPVLKIENSGAELEKYLLKIDEYDALIFTSANGARAFFERCNKDFLEEKLFLKTFCAVGEKTKLAIEREGFDVAIVPNSFTAIGLADAIFKSGITFKKALFLHGNLSEKEVQTELLKRGIAVDSVEVYRTIPFQPDKSEVLKTREMLLNGETAVVTFFSPSSVENFLKIISKEFLKDVALAAVGTTTENALLKNGLKADIVPKGGKFTAEKLAEEIAEFLKHNPTHRFPPARE
jgi:uroporphyrinogen-III synthase